MRILIVEDDDLVADAIAGGLRKSDFLVDRAASAEAALAALATDHFDLAVVDVGLPGADGLSFVGTLRSTGRHLPILILTARDALDVKVEAFDIGADDFLMKPFEQAELAARCRALIRRANLQTSGRLSLGRIGIDIQGRSVHIDSQSVELTGREWLILECLALNAGRIVSKDRLQQAITTWDQALTPNAVEVYVSRVRAKLGDAAVIRTVRGLGYRLDEQLN
jgi:two-component system, OmpR family, response regulator